MINAIERELANTVIKNVSNASVSVTDIDKITLSSEKIIQETQNYSREYLLSMKSKFQEFITKINERIEEIDKLLKILDTVSVGESCLVKDVTLEKIEP